MPLLPDDNLFIRSTCAALVITCSDFRFKSAERSFASSLGLADDYDLIARPGAIRSIVEPRTPDGRQSLLEEIGLLWRLHSFQRVLMLNHMSCRAYDDLTAGRDERSVHADHLQEAARVIEKSLAGVKAEPYLVALVDGAITAQRVD